MEKIFFCFEGDEESEYDPHAVEPENYLILEMLIFSENHWLYQLLQTVVSVLYLATSYFYLYISANRYNLELHLDDHLKIVYYFESVFAIHMIVQFFKEFTPEGGGDRQKPVR